MLRLHMPLPPLPKVVLRELRDLSPPEDAGFLRLRRRQLVVADAHEDDSQPFVYDHVERKALDAVVIAAHYRADGRRWVYLRSALRPPAWLRPMDARPYPEKETLGALWELPAGLVEPDECSTAGLRSCAARELHEEIGFRVAAGELRSLGPSSFPSPGVIGERHHYFHVEVSPAQQGEPTEDGSVLERGAMIVAVTLDEALELVRDGTIEDAKSEIGLRRLAEL